MRPFIDLSGKTFGRLTVLCRSDKSATGMAMWKCTCECGIVVCVQSGALKNGHTKSCGCYMREVSSTIGKSTKKVWLPINYSEDAYLVPLNGTNLSKIDKEDYSRISEYSWYLMNTGYAGAHCGECTVLMHRIITCAPYNTFVDHISMDKLDNRKCNLRLVEFSDNVVNTRLSVRNSTGYRGVTFDKQTGTWRALCTRRGKKFNLGRHITPESAALSYDKIIRETDGKYARLNFPKEGELSCH